MPVAVPAASEPRSRHARYRGQLARLLADDVFETVSWQRIAATLRVAQSCMDSWMRRRLRCFQWKQRKRGKTRFAEVRKRGVGKDLAAQAAGSPDGPWHRSRGPALSIALPGAHFDSLGLPRLANPPRL